MLKVENFVTPSPEQWELVIHGSRNAFKSWSKSDSGLCDPNEHYNENCDKRCTFMMTGECDDPWITSGFILGQNDENLFKSLCKLGSSDRKLLRQLPIIMEITAPEYWYRQFDTYKIGTTANSTSQMHCLLKKSFEMSDFSLDEPVKDFYGWGIDEQPELHIEWFGKKINIKNYKHKEWFNFTETADYTDENDNTDYVVYAEADFIMKQLIDYLNFLRELYFVVDENRKEHYWFKILQLIPQSFNYTRTVSLNYEVALNITQQRYKHDLTEWHTLIQYFINELPYFDLILQAVGLTEELKQHGYEL